MSTSMRSSIRLEETAASLERGGSEVSARWRDVIWTDILGHPHVVRQRLDPAENAGGADGGSGELRIDATDAVVSHDGQPQVAPRPLVLRVDPGTAFPSPWEPDVQLTIGELFELDGSRSPLCSRGALRGVLERAAGMGFEVKTAAELELYLVNPATMRPIYDEIANYSITKGAQLEEILRPIRTDLGRCDIPIEAMNPEYSGGQVEINIRYGPALRSADRGTLLRLLVRRAAARGGLMATFMAKPWAGRAGSGLHVHQSLWTGGTNMMAEPGGGEGLSELGTWYVAGLLEHTQRLSLLGCSTPNGFHRRADGSFAPTVVSWGSDNRTLSTRAVEAGGSATRVEQRDASADANIYLVMAGQIAAGLDGVAQRLIPQPRSTGNAYADRSLRRVPRTFVEAFDRFADDPEVRRLLPAGTVEAYIAALEPELEPAITFPADWERERYIRAV
jgi:glutamine synthetase